MRIRLDNILLCTLWLLAVTLGTCFWFNTTFSFDIFSASHWEYISSLQASRAPIKTSFYVSMAFTIFITIFGIYLIVRPTSRKIRLPIMKIDNKIKDLPKTDVTESNSDASTLNILPAENRPERSQNSISAPSPSARPPRLILPTLNNNFISPTSSAPDDSGFRTQVVSNNEKDISELYDIFSNAGYTVKPNARINGQQTALIAIGTNETMWLGCIGIKTTDVRAMIEKIQQIFSDTLDETEISVTGFVIGALDAATSEFQDILMFNNITDLREYMQDRQNPPLPENDDGMFDAYSQYIDAVIKHIGKI